MGEKTRTDRNAVSSSESDSESESSSSSEVCVVWCGVGIESG
jgi:hypothetical protein